jgi:hypothetical protein
VTHPGARPTERMQTVDTPRVHPHDHDDDTVEAHYACLERPCACNDGWVTIGQIAVDPQTGEEAEEFALYLCRRCADSR